MIRPGEELYYYHDDHLGTPQVFTDESQTVSWKAVYAAFGEAEIQVEAVENPFRFPGQYYDQETGLHYNWNRYYDPKTGRYLTPDPIGLDGGINLFVYSEDNPLIDSDPYGLSRRMKECEKIAPRLEGILTHSKKHIRERISLKPICVQLARELGPFLKNGCLAYPKYQDLGRRVSEFMLENCEDEIEKFRDCCEKLKVPLIVVVGGYLVIKFIEACIGPWRVLAPL